MIFDNRSGLVFDRSALRRILAGILFVFAAILAAPHANAQPATADVAIEAQPLDDALIKLSTQTGVGIFARGDLVEGLQAPPLSGTMTMEDALRQLLNDTGLTFQRNADGSYVVLANASSAVGQRQPGIEEIIVTGQKREERIQDVPIAISAFSAEDLEAQKLEGGFDLLKAIPNVSFSKTNFTSYNFQIRGVGTQSISATSDPGVAVSFNNAAIIQNRLFEQEYLDVERVEVLRGPQGTLYGRNATAGVINVITNKPEMGVWDGMLDVEVGNYNTRRLRGHFNMPIGDTFAIRGAYASTIRDGYTFNSGTGNSVDGRDLWTGRLSLGWQPSDRFRADFIYERFEEEDDRLRTGKQLCHRDRKEGIGDLSYDDTITDYLEKFPGVAGSNTREEVGLKLRAIFNQGCKAGSLYSDAAFGTPNSMAYNFQIGLVNAISLTRIGSRDLDGDGVGDVGTSETIIQIVDAYGGKRQSRDLREIESIRDPVYRASADLFQLNIDFDLTDALTFSSQTVYNEDETYSFQDFNRFNSEPVFTDTSQLFHHAPGIPPEPSLWENLAPGGVYCDPQIGCSDTIAGFDIAQASAEQFNQEFRLQSSFAGPLNFSVGANYTEFESLVDYYVMFNLISAMASIGPFNSEVAGVGGDGFWDQGLCASSRFDRNPSPHVPTTHPESPCPFIDPNPVDTSRNFGTGGNGEGEGHNYFRSKNPYELESWAAFGELYWNIRDDLKLTAGLRYTDDTKTFTVVPSQALLSPSFHVGGVVPAGYPVDKVIEQNWGEWTGRLVLDWQPVLAFTDETLIYGSFSRGYKGGGANPPTPDFATLEETRQFMLDDGYPEFGVDILEEAGWLPVLELTADEYDETFEPEFVNAFELGTKNTLFGGAVMLNATAFYYDYTDYQVSQIRDRTAVNENFDSEMWGLEIESVFSPTPNWQFLANVGYLKTEIAEGETSIDIMNRTQGNEDYTLVKPWAQLPSNCVVPTEVAESWFESLVDPSNQRSLISYGQFCGIGGFLYQLGGGPPTDPNTGQDWDLSSAETDELYPEINGGAGLEADLGGNELPNSPNLTVTLGGQYSFDLTPDWRATTRIDYYWQDDSYHRVYNTEPYDRLKSWSNTNLSFWVNNPNSGITVEAYVKNLFNQTPITGAFLNSDDTGLTTNVFMFDPRLIGVSIRKEW